MQSLPDPDSISSDSLAFAAACRVINVIRDLRIRNELWADDGPDAQLPACVLKNPDVTAHDRLNNIVLAEPLRGSTLQRLVAAIIAWEMTQEERAVEDEVGRLRARVAELEAELATAPPQTPGTFKQEMATYTAHKGRLIATGHEGDYVVVKGDDLDAPFATYDAALEYGYMRHGLMGFMVKQILAVDRVLMMWPG